MNFIFPYFGNNTPNWLIFRRGWKTTNQINVCKPGKDLPRPSTQWIRLLTALYPDPGGRAPRLQDGHRSWLLSNIFLGTTRRSRLTEWNHSLEAFFSVKSARWCKDICRRRSSHLPPVSIWFAFFFGIKPCSSSSEALFQHSDVAEKTLIVSEQDWIKKTLGVDHSIAWGPKKLGQILSLSGCDQPKTDLKIRKAGPLEVPIASRIS